MYIAWFGVTPFGVTRKKEIGSLGWLKGHICHILIFFITEID